MGDLFDLSGKVAIVTGASSGLGAQFAECLAGRGARLTVVARRIEKLRELADRLEEKGTEVLPLQCDVTNDSEVKEAVNKTIDKFGQIDILVNNAGVGAVEPLEDTSRAKWDQVMDVNVTGVFLFTKYVIKHMKQKKYGKIINISSMFGHVGNTSITTAAYHASKGAVNNFTKALAGEFSKYNITSNAIGPGFFESEMTSGIIHDEEFVKFVQSRCPMQRIGREGELNGALLFLTSDASSYVSGQTIYVDGGWTSV